MLSEGDKMFQIKIGITHGENASECYQALREACWENVLPYRMLARWVKAFPTVHKENSDL